MMHAPHQDQGIGSTLSAAYDSNQLGCGATLERQIPLAPSKPSLKPNAILVSESTHGRQVHQDATGPDSTKRAKTAQQGGKPPPLAGGSEAPFVAILFSLPLSFRTPWFSMWLEWPQMYTKRLKMTSVANVIHDTSPAVFSLDLNLASGRLVFAMLVNPACASFTQSESCEDLPSSL
jgi:hypothetical protein